MTGTVLEVSGRTARIQGLSGWVAVLRHVTSISVGDTAVVILSGGASWVVGVVGATAPPTLPPPVDPPPLPAPPPMSAPRVARRPSWSGSWRGGVWRADTSDLWHGDPDGLGVNSGAAWWGVLPPGIVSATVTFVRIGGVGSTAAPVELQLLAGTSRPAGPASVIDSVPGPVLVPATSTTWAVPAEWITSMNAGVAGGLGISPGEASGPLMVLSASGVGMTLALSLEA